MKKKFITVKLKDITPYENNPRNNEAAIGDVIASIKQCENLDPIEIDEGGVILSGHTRYEALKRLGYEETEVVKYEGLTEEQKTKYRLLANKIGEKATWDFNKLAVELEGLDFEGYDFGFEGLDLDVSDFGEEFSLPDGDQPEIRTMTFALHEEQQRLIEEALEAVKDDITETFGNTNKNGNALYEVVRQWQMLKTSK